MNELGLVFVWGLSTGLALGCVLGVFAGIRLAGLAGWRREPMLSIEEELRSLKERERQERKAGMPERNKRNLSAFDP